MGFWGKVSSGFGDVVHAIGSVGQRGAEAAYSGGKDQVGRWGDQYEQARDVVDTGRDILDPSNWLLIGAGILGVLVVTR